MTLDKSTWTLVDLARRQADSYGEREFIRFEQGTRLTFAGLDTDSNSLARNLAGLGVVPGDRVLVLLKNRAEFILVMLATMKLGAIFVPVNTELKGAFLQHQLINAEPRVVFVDASLSSAFTGLADVFCGRTGYDFRSLCGAGSFDGGRTRRARPPGHRLHYLYLRHDRTCEGGIDAPCALLPVRPAHG